MSIKRLLVANRGEIACRIMRTANKLGIETVAVYSEADRDALHVSVANQAIFIGPSAAAESYLAIDRILEAAQRSGSDAVHPGYGFLSENAEFADACRSAGLIFVGPSSSAISLMGDKAKAKRAMLEAGVPCVPGYQGDDQSDAVLASEADLIGFPLMIKATAGGGGRGMRLVHDSTSFESAIGAARSEATSAFGNGDVILERAVIEPRHVEIQVFGDQHGTILHLGERDCSVQRRHQKVIEESPCPVVTPELRMAMGEAAIAAAKAVSYEGAGTVEFLLDKNGSFYFLEMNTRLQVEHPVTEAVTRLDLVELQLRVAQGQPLGITQEEVQLRGHAIEVRLYAEDPANDFLPDTGTIHGWIQPSGAGIRVDSGVEPGSNVSPFYDPMIAKVVAFGATRDEARRRLLHALSASSLIGPATNRDFLIDALGRSAFVEGLTTTAFITQEHGSDGFAKALNQSELAIGVLASHLRRSDHALRSSLGLSNELLNWSTGSPLRATAECLINETRATCSVQATGPNRYRVQVGDEADCEIVLHHRDDQALVVEIDGHRSRVVYFDHDDGVSTSIATTSSEVTIVDVSGIVEAPEHGDGSGRVVAPMHGQLLELRVEVGDTVSIGQCLLVLEAMKMEHEVLSEVDGVVAAVHVSAPSQVGASDLLLEIESSAAEQTAVESSAAEKSAAEKSVAGETVNVG